MKNFFMKKIFFFFFLIIGCKTTKKKVDKVTAKEEEKNLVNFSKKHENELKIEFGKPDLLKKKIENRVFGLL